MFEFVYKHRKAIQIVFLILIVPPFMLFGVDVYFRDVGGGQSVARVGDYSITQDEFGLALRDRQAAIQRAAGGRIDPAMLDNPELRRSVLESLVHRRLLVEQARKTGLTVTDESLRNAINDVAVFRDESGKFSYPRYQEFLKSEGMTPAVFESRLRQDILIRQVADGFADTGFLPRTVVGMLESISGQQREVSHAAVQPEAYLSQVKLAADAAKQYYDANAAEFRVPEQARVEYVTLSIEALMQSVQVPADDAKKFYETNRRQFGAEESRDAAHILVAADTGAGAGDREKAKAKAGEIYRELQKNPAGFAEAAKKHSQDPGSSAEGGSLGRLSRGSMKDVPEFEEALFALKSGEISKPVESKLGYHIIRVAAVHPAQIKPFEEVREGIEKELRKQQAGRRFAELADGFNNVVYEQSDTLKPAAELVKSPSKQSGWITRADAAPPLNHPRLLGAIFSDEALKDKRNTEAVEVAPGTIVAARVIETKPASTQAFEEVRAALDKRLALREAAKLAQADGRRRLDELKQGKPVSLQWSAPVVVSRDDGKDLPEPVLRQAFRADAAKLPAYAGVDDARGGYTWVRVSRVEQVKLPQEKAQALEQQVRAVLAQEAMAAYVASLKLKTGVKINKEQLEKKQQ
jgi:peptidyl-prolyl cis-trans isomerase D